MTKVRFFDDLAVGQVFGSPSYLVTSDEIVTFAQQYDPQPFYTDPQAVVAGPFGRHVASGWHTAARSDARVATEVCRYVQAVLVHLPARSITRAQLAAVFSAMRTHSTPASSKPRSFLPCSAGPRRAMVVSMICSTTAHAMSGREQVFG